MRNYISKQIFLCFLLVFTLFIVRGQDFPETPQSLVSDYTGTLDRNEIAALERKLLAFEDSTSIQIAVVLVQSVNGYDIKDYAVRLAQKWGVGQKKYDNGIMLLAALGDREVTIQTGYGIEGAVPDAIAYRIIDNDIKPNFRAKRYYQGLDEATSSLISYTKGEYKGEPRKNKGSKGTGGGGIVLIVIIFIIIAFISKGGGKNGGGRVMGGKGSNDLFWWALLSGLGGGRSGGGSGGFGGGSGGGFGGFGGGGFGGGGASGRW